MSEDQQNKDLTESEVNSFSNAGEISAEIKESLGSHIETPLDSSVKTETDSEVVSENLSEKNQAKEGETATEINSASENPEEKANPAVDQVNKEVSVEAKKKKKVAAKKPKAKKTTEVIEEAEETAPVELSPEIHAKISEKISEEISAATRQVSAAVDLLDSGSTVPFIARYRKEATGGLDDTQLRLLESRLAYLREMEGRRQMILRTIEEQGKLTEPLRASIMAAETKQVLEDLYLPYKPKRKTKGMIAIEAGLLPLAESLLADPNLKPEEEAAKYLNPDLKFPDIESVLNGCKFILQERFAENAELVGNLRLLVSDSLALKSTVKDGKSESGIKFKDYFDFVEPTKKIPSHRFLAVLRGRSQGVLSVELTYQGKELGSDELNEFEQKVANAFAIENKNRPADAWLINVARSAWRLKIWTRLEVEFMQGLREKADGEAIGIFAKNMRDLLLGAPAGKKVVIGLDPGIRTGVKTCVVDATGKLLETLTIYPFEPKKQVEASIKTLAELAKKYSVDVVAIGNGTASRETEKLVRDTLIQNSELSFSVIVVSEAGASVYSASEYAAKEFPDLDVSLRGAVSIARRLQDPLAELVKIEPKSIGVGQYQHDVSQSKLALSLDKVVEDCVNWVGVDLNTASAPLLTRVSGLNSSIASSIVQFREKNGAFRSRQQLMEVPKLGEKTFEQAAGFLRIQGGENPLDASSVHPESYDIVGQILTNTGKSLPELIGNSDVLSSIDPKRYVSEKAGEMTIRDILKELEKPGRDPRPEFRTVKFADGVNDIKDLKPGMILEGMVTNVTNFGAFVDIGVHRDGLVHVSSMSTNFVNDPSKVVKANDIVQVKVVEVDEARQRIGLTMVLSDAAEAPRRERRPKNEQRGDQEERKSREKRSDGNKKNPRKDRPKKENSSMSQNFGDFKGQTLGQLFQEQFKQINTKDRKK